jgi:glyoxylate reductase
MADQTGHFKGGGDLKPKVLVTRILPKPAMEIIEAECDADINERDVRYSKQELMERAEGREGMVCLLTDEIDAEVIGACRGMKVIANVAVGYNNIDLEAASRERIVVTNTPGVLTETTADLAWSLLMTTARRLVEADRYLRADKWKEWGLNLLLGGDVYGKTLGIVGFGRIGQAMARRARGFDMRVLYYDNNRANATLERELNASYTDLETLLKEADFVTLHVPLTEETRHLIGEREFSMMKSTAYMINTSRGPVVDEAALVEALRNGTIAGAGLDVFEREPQVEEGLLGLDNTVLLPHIGSASVATRTRMATMAAENLLAALKGERPPNAVNPEVLEG